MDGCYKPKKENVVKLQEVFNDKKEKDGKRNIR